MPDRFGFDHLTMYGAIECRCIWCSLTVPSWTKENELERHARTHRRDAAAAHEAAERECTASLGAGR
jgi:hypothetical protein